MTEVKERAADEGEANALDHELDGAALQELGPAATEAAAAAMVSGATGPHGGLLVALCHIAEDRFGLRVAECDAPGAPGRWGPVHRVHASGSYHYQHRGADISGLAQNMARFAHWVEKHHLTQIAELIHNPNASVKNGKPVSSGFWGAETWSAHANHVHLAI